MRLLILLPIFLCGCTEIAEEVSDDTASRPLISETGRLENKKLDEASGLAVSRRAVDLYWSINDDGPAVIYALNAAGQDLGRVRVEGAENRDWEDLASFELDGNAYLVAADIGDNQSRRQQLSLYVVAEPDPAQEQVDIAWQIDFVYPDGPRDAESVAVDAAAGHVYVLSKRTVPAELYQLPLRPGSESVFTAAAVGDIDSLPQPSPAQLQDAAGNGWGWQPTAMDLAPDGGSVLVLTYDGINFFARKEGDTLPEAMQGRALHLSLGDYKDAESISYTADSAAAVVTFEGKHSTILRIELDVAAGAVTSSPAAPQ